MPAGEYPILIEQNATWRLQLTIKNADGTLRDLTGVHARMQIRATPADPAALATLDSDPAAPADGQMVIDPAAGTITVVLPSSATGSYLWTGARYDLLASWPDGDDTRLLQGQVTVSPGVTRWT